MTTADAPDKVELRSWLPSFLVLAAIWGSSFLFIKVGIEELHPIYVTLGRAASGMITLLILLLVLRDRLPRDPVLWFHLTVIGTIGVAVPFTLFGYGEQRVSSLLAGIWNATTPLVVLPLAVLLFRTERMTAAQGDRHGARVPRRARGAGRLAGRRRGPLHRPAHVLRGRGLLRRS